MGGSGSKEGREPLLQSRYLSPDDRLKLRMVPRSGTPTDPDEAEFDPTRLQAALDAYVGACDLFEMTSNGTVSLRKCREKHAMLCASSPDDEKQQLEMHDLFGFDFSDS